MTILKKQANQFLIIGGTTKAATTSLYYYLADHPSVCVSTLKETRFFIDEDYPVSPLGAKWADGIDKYEEFFNNCPNIGCLRVEATPDYLYSSGTPKKIKKSLPNAKLLFILREPVSRLISWYKFAKQKAHISEQMSFDEYVEKQLKGGQFEKAKQAKLESSQNNFIPQYYFLSALEQGCYSTYLQQYFDILGRGEY